VTAEFNPEEHYLHLISATIQHAVANTRYYAEVFAGLSSEPTTLAEFSKYPVLTRQIIAERGEDLVSNERVPDFLLNTSGTTFGTLSRNPLVTFHTREEADVWKLIMLEKSEGRSEIKPLMLRFLSLDHGLDVAGGIQGVFPVPLVNTAHFAHVHHLLQRRFSFPGFTDRIQGLVGTLTRLKILTILCQRHGSRREEFDVRFIGCHSQLLTNRWRAFLQSYWGIEPTEIYGISEIPGLIGARCASCGYYHLSPVAYVETVDPETYEPVTSGIARLVATGLYPLVEAQPLIRYDTEDIVQLMPGCTDTYQPSLEYVGRADTVIWTREGGQTVLLISPMALHNVLDDEPSINIEPSPFAASFGIKEVGFLKYDFRHRTAAGRVEVSLEIELRWVPEQYPDYANTLEARIRKRLYEVSPALESAIHRGAAALSVNLLPPESLSRLAEA
jgi:phenylacetate-coenzyme A ligase PaaK-like adenylate-forming protein